MRVEATSPEQSPNGKWSATFATHKGQPGEEYISGLCTSGAVFDTEAQAEAGALRALRYLDQCGRFPNMCVPF